MINRPGISMKKILVCFVGLALTACSANSLNYGAEQVRVMTSEPGKECSYLGDITGSQGISLPVAGLPTVTWKRVPVTI